MNMRTIIAIIILCIFCPGCQNSLESKHILKQWLDKEIIFPPTLKAKVYGKDTIATNYLNKKYKILIHVDSSGCSECKLGLYKWSKLIEEYKQYKNNIEFIFVVHVLNHRQMTIICRQNQFKHILYYDINGQMNKINNFLENPMYRCFLLNENNKVILIGNPFYSEKLMSLYKQKLNDVLHH